MNVQQQSNGKLHATPSGFAYFNGPQYQTIHQFSGRGPLNVPVTGESMKASAQVMLNPGKSIFYISKIIDQLHHIYSNSIWNSVNIGYSYAATPVCFYPTQAVQQLRVPQQPVWTMQQVTPAPGIMANNQGGNHGADIDHHINPL